MKHTLREIQDFLLQHGMEATILNLKLTSRGQVETCTGSFTTKGEQLDSNVSKKYRKTLVSNDYRFLNTELEIHSNNTFAITSTNQ